MSLNTLRGPKRVQVHDGFSLFVYVYDRKAFYSGAKCFGNSEELKAAFELEITPAIREGREVRIRDGGDFLCFHAKGGEVVYPRPGRFSDGSSSN